MNYKSTSNCLLFLLTAFFTFTIFFASFTILPHYVMELGGTELQSGLQSTLFFFSAVALRFYFGPLADSKGIRITLIIGVFAFATASLLFIWSSSMFTLTIARLYQSIGLATFFPSGGALVAAIAPISKRGTYIGIYRISLVSALMFGPFIAEAVIANHGFYTWFMGSFVLGCAALIMVFFVKTPLTSFKEKSSYSSKIFAVLKNKNLWHIYLGIALSATAFGILLTFASLHISRVTQVGNPGIYFTFFSLSGLAASSLAGYFSDRLGRPAVFWPSIGLLGFGLAILFFIPGKPLLMFLSSILAGLGNAASMAVGTAWIIDAAGENMKATALAMQENVIDAAIGMGSFLLGIIIALIGMGKSFALSGSAICLAGLIIWRKDKK